jgi:hypothetical protein
MMRRLIVEFSDELSALGVTVDGIDSRLAVLENDLGGWQLSGEFEFNAKIGSNGTIRDVRNAARLGGTGLSSSGLDGVVDFDLDKYRVFLNRRINETTAFHARLGKGLTESAGLYNTLPTPRAGVPNTAVGVNSPSGHSNDGPAVVWQWYYITTRLGYDITLDAGRFNFNWEDALGLVADDSAFVGDITTQQFRLSKDWGLANLQFVFGRLGDDWANEDNINGSNRWNYSPTVGLETFLVAGLADFQFNEKFQAGVMGYYLWSEQDFVSPGGVKQLDLGVYAKFKFTPSVELKGIYYYRDLEQGISNNTYIANGSLPLLGGWNYDRNYVDDSFNAWKLILKLEQDLLKFTDLQIEYAQIDNGFAMGTIDNNPYDSVGNNILMNMPVRHQNPAATNFFINTNTTKVIGVKANQKWGESRWDSWLRYYHADYDTAGLDDVQNFGLGIGYQLNPAVHFELAVDYIDFGDVVALDAAGARMHNLNSYTDEDIVVRFQTKVSF